MELLNGLPWISMIVCDTKIIHARTLAVAGRRRSTIVNNHVTCRQARALRFIADKMDSACTYGRTVFEDFKLRGAPAL